MFSTSSSQIQNKNKNKPELQTGMSFTKEESFSLEIEAEREYVHRLKIQREKIEALYSKYDVLLEDMKKKDEKIKEQQKRINELSTKCKEYTLYMPEVDLLRKQNSELAAENESVRYNLMEIEEAYMTALNQFKSKTTLNEKEREKIEEFNEQLVSKIRILQQKMEDKQFVHQKDRKTWTEKLDQLQKQTHELKDKHVSQIAIMNTEILSRDEKIDILLKQNQQLRESLIHWEQSNMEVAQYTQQKFEKLNADYKLKIKSIKQEIEDHLYNNEILTNKINTMSLQIQKLNQENAELRDKITDEKRKCQQTLYEVKLSFNQQKSIIREHTMQLESKLAKVEKQLGDSLRRERDLMNNIKRLEQSEQVKKSLRQVERRELEKINRLLLLQK